mmetsp:Transcript_77087/g.226099  ORF Transcript_77087/g.226099 Transcript_77087/m.226099 type:complete len:200 (+) Transcript_77087:702-1301(+)
MHGLQPLFSLVNVERLCAGINEGCVRHHGGLKALGLHFLKPLLCRAHISLHTAGMDQRVVVRGVWLHSSLYHTPEPRLRPLNLAKPCACVDDDGIRDARGSNPVLRHPEHPGLRCGEVVCLGASCHYADVAVLVGAYARRAHLPEPLLGTAKLSTLRIGTDDDVVAGCLRLPTHGGEVLKDVPGLLGIPLCGSLAHSMV